MARSNWSIVLTADRALMTNYSDLSFLGFGHCVPYRLLPKPLLERVLGPPIRTDRNGRASTPPYPLRKLEAALLNAGFDKDEVIITTPEKLDKVVSENTEIVGLSVVDPMGRSPVSYTLSSLFGGGDSATKIEFLNLIEKVKKLRKNAGFTLVVGGQGAWQLPPFKDSLGIDTLFFDEGEVTFPELARKIINGEEPPAKIHGETPSNDQIPAIVGPSRGGDVQVTRGCPRRCQFCAPTKWNFRSMSLEKISKEVEVNIRGGAKGIGLASEDILLYGANGIKVNRKAVIRLFRLVAEKHGVTPYFAHVSPATVRQDPDLVKEVTEIAGYDERSPVFMDVGIESGSPRLIGKYMAGKPSPWKPEEWPETVLEATRIMNENYWYPCYTMMVGFPDETEEDLIKTIELVDELREMKAMAWTFPLLTIPMGGTGLEKEKYPNMLEMPETVWQLFYKSWSHSLWFSQKIRRELIGDTNSLTKILVDKLYNAVINELREQLEQLRKDPEKTLEEYSRINLNSIRGMLSLASSLLRSLLHRRQA